MPQPPVFKEIDTSQFKRCFIDLPYATTNDPDQKLDIYLPDEGDGPFPLIIFVHGGGWVMGGRRNSTMPGVFKFMSQGYAMATIEYRLAPAVHWPAPLEDVRCAIRFLRANAAQYHLDPTKFAIMGNSAGGHLANMAAALGGRNILRGEQLGYADVDDSVQCLISVFSPTDIYKLDMDDWFTLFLSERQHGNIVINSDAQDPAEKNHNIMLGFVARENPAGAANASPIDYVTESFPPAYYLQGLRDQIVPYTQSLSMWRKVNMVCGKSHAKLELFPEAMHGDEAMKTDEVMNHILDFVDAHLWEGKHERTPLPPDVKVID